MDAGWQAYRRYLIGDKGVALSARRPTRVACGSYWLSLNSS